MFATDDCFEMEGFDADTAMQTIDDPGFEPGPGSFTWLTGGP